MTMPERHGIIAKPSGLNIKYYHKLIYQDPIKNVKIVIFLFP